MTTDMRPQISSRNDHSYCIICGSRNPRSMRLRFRSGDDGVARTMFRADPRLQGYDGIIHGGVIAALLDAAMTHCLFYQKVQGVTVDLHIRFVCSIPCEAEMEIRAWLVSSRRSLYRLKAEIESENRIAAWAEATFMPRRICGAAAKDPGRRTDSEEPCSPQSGE